MGKSKKITVGYTYYMALHMAICRVCDSLVQIRVGEKEAWKGNARDNQTINIDKGGLFGGKKAEGGIDGPFKLLMGGPDQKAPDEMKRSLGGRVPGFRGFVSAFFDGMYAQMNPYPKPWAFRVRRIYSGWQDDRTWYSSRARILLGDTSDENGLKAIHAMNPAHIIMLVMLDKQIGRGLDLSMIDQQSFREVADQLYTEKFGLCLPWTREESVGDFTQSIIDHIGGAMFQSRRTGLLKLALIRNDYNPNTLPHYDVSSGILEITKAEVANRPAVINEVIINYTNPVTNEKGSQRAQSLAGFQTDGSSFSVTLDMPGLPTALLAQQVAQRELKTRSVGLRRFTIRFDRRAHSLEPAGVFRLTDASRGLYNVVLRVGEYDDGSPEDPVITVVCVEDIFSFALSTFSQPQDNEFVPPDMTPKLARRRIFEIPYAQLVGQMDRADFQQIDPENGYLGAVAEQPTGTHNGYEIATLREGESKFDITGHGDFVPLCELAGETDYLTTEIKFVKPIDIEDVGTEIDLPTAVLVDEEVMIVHGITGDVMTVSRGGLDTVPARHGAGAEVWFYEELIGTDEHEYVGGEEVRVKILPWTLLGGTYPVDDAPIDNLVFNYRYLRPYAPGRVLANDVPWYEPITLEGDQGLDLRWAHRDRVGQVDRLIGHEQGNIGPEPKSSYGITVRDENGDEVRKVTGITGTDWQYDAQTALQDLGIGDVNEDIRRTLYLNLVTQRREFGELLNSWQGYDLVATVIARKFFLQVAHLLRQIAVESSGPGLDGLYVASLHRQIAVESSGPGLDGLYVASLHRQVSSITNFPGTPDRFLFERPYILALRSNQSVKSHNISLVAAQPRDLIPDYYTLFSVLNPKKPPGDFNPGNNPPKPEDKLFGHVDVQQARWSRWAILDEKLLYDTPYMDVSFTSLVVKLPLGGLPAGTLIAVDEEIMTVVSADDTQLRVKRGSADTIPAQHNPQARVWVLQAGAEDRIATTINYPDENWIGIKTEPQQFADRLSFNQMATDQKVIRSRVDRPYPPGRVLVDGDPWYNGGVAGNEKSMTITWVDRNRITQGATAVGHEEDSIAREPNSWYRVLGQITYFPKGSKEPVTNTYIDDRVDGLTWTLDADRATRIGYSIAGILDICGGSGITLKLFTVRDGLESWQKYDIRVSLPAPACPTGKRPTFPPRPYFPPHKGGSEPPPPPPPSTIPGGGGGGGSNNTPPSDQPLPDPPSPDDDDNEKDEDQGQDPEPVDPNLPENPEDPNAEVGSWGKNWGYNWADSGKGDKTNGS